MPSDPLEAELLAMAGAALGADNFGDESDDSLPEDNYDAAPDVANNYNNVPKFSEDIENMMSGKKHKDPFKFVNFIRSMI